MYVCMYVYVFMNCMYKLYVCMHVCVYAKSAFESHFGCRLHAIVYLYVFMYVCVMYVCM
jgi:hypothetical protein